MWPRTHTPIDFLLVESIEERADRIHRCYKQKHLLCAGTRMDLGRAIKDRVLEGEDVLVYDTRLGKRVSLSAALKRGMVDRMTGEYIDRDTGSRIEAKEAAKMGLLAVVGEWQYHGEIGNLRL